MIDTHGTRTVWGWILASNGDAQGFTGSCWFSERSAEGIEVSCGGTDGLNIRVGQTPLELCEEPVIDLIRSDARQINVNLCARVGTLLPCQELETEFAVVMNGAGEMHLWPSCTPRECYVAGAVTIIWSHQC